ncbi:MAG TPA: hypothetical protein VF038_05630 [Usitatibacter sp.]|jgi:hypothetical protein
MDARGKFRSPRNGLCLTCVNRAAAESRGPARRRAMECLAGGEPREALYECASYVRVFTRAPHVPEKFRRRPGQ